jgi:hypothetical protein
MLTLQDVRTVVSMPVTHQAWQITREDQAEFSVWHSCPFFFVLDGQFRYADRFFFSLQNWTATMICRWSRLHISKTERLCLVVVMVPPVRGGREGTDGVRRGDIQPQELGRYFATFPNHF